MSKTSQELLKAHNKERCKQGLPPLASLKYEKLDHDKVRSARNLPNYNYTPRPDPTKSIPSLSTTITKDATARNSVMDKVQSGEITGKDAEEILRKSKCLAPAYNKGAVQYIGDESAARDAGKKT